MKKLISPKLISITFGVLVLCFVVGFYTFAAWQEPGAEPPGGNVDVPINVSGEEQSKTGRLGVATADADDSFGLTVGSSGIKVTGGSWFQDTVNSAANFCIDSGLCLSDAGEVQDIVAGKGLQRDASNNFGLIDCATDDYILKYDLGTGNWACAQDLSGAGGFVCSSLDDCCGIDGKILKRSAGAWSCADDTVGITACSDCNATFINESQANSITSGMISDGTITYSDTNVNSVQRRVSSSCGAGSSIRVINSNGTVTCETDDAGGGWSSCNTIESNCNYVNESGDTMSGNLNMGGNDISVFQLNVTNAIYNSTWDRVSIAEKLEAIGLYSSGSSYGTESYGSYCGVYGYGNSYDFIAGGPGVDYGVVSSIRWKKDIELIDNALEKVLKLRGIYFDWDEEHGGEHDMGMIAEEVGEVVPEIVSYEKDGKYATGMDYGHLTPLLIEAIKEQQKQIENLKTEIEFLKTN